MLESFCTKVAGLQPASFSKRDSNTSAFLWSLMKFKKLLRTPILKNICKRLLLEVYIKKLFFNLRNIHRTKKKSPFIKLPSQHFEKVIYQCTDITWLLTDKHLCWSVNLILSIAKFLTAPILKNICELLLLKMCSWNHEKLKFIHSSFNFTFKKQVFSTSISEKSSL